MKQFLALSLSLSLLACGGDDGGGDNQGGPDGAPAQSVSIQDVQSDAMAVGTSVTLSGVVVTAVDAYGGRVGAIYVEEPDGGPFSGVVVNTSAVPAGLEVGSIVTVTGKKDEFALSDDMTGRTVTQIGNPQVTVTGSGTVPAPEVLDPRTLAADEVEAEKWEGVLVTFENVAFESLPRGVTSTDDTLLEARVTGPFPVQSALVEFPEGIAYRDCYASVTGVGDYFFDYKILPRSADDFVSGGTGCPAEEAVCDNGVDDDADGFEDCADFACFVADAADTGPNLCADDTATVIKAQDGTSIAFGEVIEIDSALVTARNRDWDEIWIQDSGSTADHNGLHVEAFRPVLADGKLPGTVVEGKKVKVVGLLRESYGETVLTNATVVVQTGNPPLSYRTAVDLTKFANVEDAASYEGQLVELTDVTVKSVGMYGQYTVTKGGGDLVVDDTLFSYDLPTADACLDLKGVILRNTYDDFYYLAPRSASDVGTGNGC